MRRSLGVLLITHGFAHSLPGMRVTDATRWAEAGSGTSLWLATVLWGVAAVGLVAGGLGLLGASAFRAHWRRLTLLGAAGSLIVLTTWWRSPWVIVALLINAGLLLTVLRAWSSETLQDGMPIGAAPVSTRTDPRFRPVRHAVGNGVSVALVVYLAVLILLRPWHMRWGSTEADLHRALPGDEAGMEPTYQIQHAVVIHATRDEIWPWLVQIGHDRGGFYSYSGLENRFGLSVRNADRIHPEWQRLAVGDTVLATPDNYLGLGRRLGWRVAKLEPNQVLVLENWGAFVLEPADAGATKLIVRTRGSGGVNLSGLALAPLGLLVFEPAHFIMQRKMLLGIKERVEASHE
jgi:hypothetical protein